MNPVTEFENKIAEFFGAPYAVAVDSATHGIELCYRGMTLFSPNTGMFVNSPRKTYLSVPMLANKLGIGLNWVDEEWQDYYPVHFKIYDAAVLWKRDSYVRGAFMCISFQYQKHLSLGRGGMILCPDKGSAQLLKLMSYDGREPNIPWREQNVSTMGYHYYMTPETAELGLSKLDAAIRTPPRIWTYEDYPDVSQFDVFK